MIEAATLLGVETKAARPSDFMPAPALGASHLRLAQLSGRAFLLGLTANILALVVLRCALKPGGSLFEVNEPGLVISLVSLGAGVPAWLTSIICGLSVVKHRPKVLWWVVPVLGLALAILAWIISSKF